jgi:formylglycine-generating enzyme required for sulfatase activity
MGEWVFDRKSNYVNPCSNCIITVGTGRVVRGGNFASYADISLATEDRSSVSPNIHWASLGVRCARMR